MADKGFADLSLEIFLGESERRHVHQSVELLYVMEGAMQLSQGEQKYQLEEDDIVIINANKPHGYACHPDCLFCRIHIPYKTLSGVSGGQMVLFWCNSALDNTESHRELRRILRETINETVNGRSDRPFNRYSLYYKLLHFITNFYVVSQDDLYGGSKASRRENRLEEIVGFIQNNYDRPISLQELADTLYLTKPYLSKYIKKTLGMNFLEYLNNIRIHHAVDDLLHTEEPVTQIALNNGFPNIATFNRLFKEHYGESPSAYRKKRRPEEMEKVKAISERKRKLLQERLDQHFMTGAIERKPAETSDVEKIEITYGEGADYTPTWNRVINVGSAEDLLSEVVQDHVRLAKRELGVLYIRFWDIFSERMYMVDEGSYGHYNFVKLNTVVDFLLENGIKPYIELAEKPQRIQKTVSEFIMPPQNKTVFHSYEEWKKCLEALLMNFHTRYGEREVSTWLFELWDDRRLETASTRIAYNQWYRDAKGLIAQYFPKVKVGGAGRYLGWFWQHTTDGIRQWIDGGVYPDFLTYTYFPYSAGEIDREVYSKRKTDEDDLRITLDEMQGELLRHGFPPRDICISEWNGTVSDRNYSNDSCWKAAWIMKECFDSIGRADVISFNSLTDYTVQHYDSEGILFGGRGIISKDGICKPSFHAFRMLGLLREKLLWQGENCLVTTGPTKEIAIACHNFKPRNYLYYVKPENGLGPQEQYVCFDEQEGKRFLLKMDGMENGEYLQKTYTFNREHGSVLDEWMKLDCMQNLRKTDVDYLRRVCVPEIALKRVSVARGTLQLEWYMQAHEIKIIELVRTGHR